MNTFLPPLQKGGRGGFPSTAIALAILLSAPTAHAEPAFARMYKQQYGYTPACNVCHMDDGGSPLNGYGKAFDETGRTLTAFANIADADSDGDGAKNAAEADAKANPGDKQSTPDAPGNWLETSNLIPKSVQAAYPDVKTYKPLDAILTESELARAAELGATLTKDDENTLYIPVADKRAAGAAVIAPGKHDGKPFFILVATDKTLTVKQVIATNTQQVPAAAESTIYASFAGVPLHELPKPNGDGSIGDAITAAVKNAGTLIHVRLKKQCTPCAGS